VFHEADAVGRVGRLERRMQTVANDVQSLIISGAGHFVAEEAADALLAGLSNFLAPSRTDAR
jgi:pimeloyl-ACP methyl ester carboxylesterase